MNNTAKTKILEHGCHTLHHGSDFDIEILTTIPTDTRKFRVLASRGIFACTVGSEPITDRLKFISNHFLAIAP